jgi:hypothetical protein
MFFYLSPCKLHGHSDRFHTVDTVLCIHLGHTIFLVSFVHTAISQAVMRQTLIL